MLHRRCTEDYVIPDTDFRIKKGTRIIISISGIHADSLHFPDPEKFDPLRFNKENIKARDPYTYLSFGAGPRDCIGTEIYSL